MVNSILSNYAANVALRNLIFNSEQASDIVGRLSSGLRIFRPSDDAAGLAIGARLRSEVGALQAVLKNSKQANSILQTANGALSRIEAILTRQRALAVQAGSASLGAQDRALLEVEYRKLQDEVRRIAADTEFNTVKLINRGESGTSQGGSSISEGAGGVINISLRGYNNRPTNSQGDGSVKVQITATAVARNQPVVIRALGTAASGGTIRFEGQLDASLFKTGGGGTQLATGTTVVLRSTGLDKDKLTTLTQDFAEVVISFEPHANQKFYTKSGGAAGNQGLFHVASNNEGSHQPFTFKVGTDGVANEDSLDFDLFGANLESLGLSGAKADTLERADAAASATSQAIDYVVKLRAYVGASQSRVSQASQVVQTSIENIEAARSAIMDADVASEVTKFVNKQILVQVGISVLAQANQLPQNLLRLFA